MSYRFMRILVFFDLPTITYDDRKAYRKFRKLLINEGFIMLQESVYTKLALNPTVSNSAKEKINREKPSNGLIQLLIITEKQYSSMEYIVGQDNTGHTINSTERLIIL